jgi:hypothetical protein
MWLCEGPFPAFERTVLFPLNVFNAALLMGGDDKLPFPSRPHPHESDLIFMRSLSEMA